MATHLEQPYADQKWSKLLPETEKATADTLILPLYHLMTEEDQDYVIDSFKEAAAS